MTGAEPVSNFSGANGDGEMFIFPVQLTTSRIGNITGLIHTLLLVYVMTIELILYTSTSKDKY